MNRGRAHRDICADCLGDTLRRLLLATLFGLWIAPACGDCLEEAHAARERVWTSGPFHFETSRWSDDLRCRSPVRAQLRSCCALPGSISPQTRVRIWLEASRWEDDGLG